MPIAPRPCRRERGFTLIELMLALALLGLFVALLSPLLMASARERRTALQEQLALQLAANQLEQLTLASPDDLKQYATAQTVPMTDDVSRWLPDVKQTVATTATEQGVRIIVSLTWQHRAGVMHKPLVLEGWSYATGGQP
ncbi:MAG TPA: prepilin-type N-terminal cleavage/methylation domain-containing protein [Planctomycetaceae bacterium]|nr:prepilin-type N-terminal cleavage/methylation domain-containing protein [Planctomycetaceae bacterium]